MSSLVTIVTFGIVGAVMMAALMGLLLLAARRPAHRGVRVAFGAGYVALLLAVPTLAAASLLGADPGAGAGHALLTAFGVLVLVLAVNVALLPAVTRRAGAHGRAERGIRVTPATVAALVVLSGLFAVVDTSIAVVLS